MDMNMVSIYDRHYCTITYVLHTIVWLAVGRVSVGAQEFPKVLVAFISRTLVVSSRS